MCVYVVYCLVTQSFYSALNPSEGEDTKVTFLLSKFTQKTFLRNIYCATCLMVSTTIIPSVENICCTTTHNSPNKKNLDSLQFSMLASWKEHWKSLEDINLIQKSLQVCIDSNCEEHLSNEVHISLYDVQ